MKYNVLYINIKHKRDIEEFRDDFSVVLRGASLCLHHSCLRLKVFTTWVFEDTKLSASISHQERVWNERKKDRRGQFAKNDATRPDRPPILSIVKRR